MGYGDASSLGYRREMSLLKSANDRQTRELLQRIEKLEKENEELRKRVKELETERVKHGKDK